MEFDYYRNFITIVEEGNLTAAAQKLGVAQPALSTQLKIMEQNYGTKLLRVHRGVRKLELTDAGAIFYEKAKYLCSIEEATRIELQNYSGGVAGTLKISLSPARAPLFMKKYIKVFHELYPKVRYQIHEVDVNTQVLHILNGIADFAIANAPLPQPDRFKILLSQKDRFVVVAHKNNPWLNTINTKIQLKELYGQPLCTNFGSYPLLNKAFLSVNITPNFISISTTRATALQFAEQNLGIAVIPSEEGEKFGNNFCSVSLDENNLYLVKTVFISKTRKLSLVAEKFLEFYHNEYYGN